MKLVFVTFILLISQAMGTCELPCSQAGAVSKEFSHDTMAIINQSEIDIVFEMAQDFLKKYEKRVDFETAIPKAIADRLEKIGRDESVKNSDRSQAYVYHAGLHGKISDKLRSKGGTAHGKIAINSLKTALNLDKTNKNAGNAYALSISGMISHNKITRSLIESAMGITLKEEARDAVKHLENMGLASHPAYKSLKEFAR